MPDIARRLTEVYERSFGSAPAQQLTATVRVWASEGVAGVERLVKAGLERPVGRPYAYR